MKISVVTPVYNCPELAADYAKVVAGCDEVIVVDNASQAPAADVWSSVGTRYIRNDVNRYYIGGCNQGFQASTGDVVIFSNNDIRGPEGSMQKWAQHIKPGVLYGPQIGMFQIPGQMITYIDAWIIGATRDTWERLSTGPGPWDEVIFEGEYANDLDVSWRATQMGIPLRRLPSPIEHLRNYTSNRTPGAFDHADANRAAFIKRVLEARDASV